MDNGTSEYRDSAAGVNKRRTIKKVIGFGVLTSAVPGTWMKPVVEAIILPSHAQTSADVTPEPAPSVPEITPTVPETGPSGPTGPIINQLTIPGTIAQIGWVGETSVRYVIDDRDPYNPLVREMGGTGDGLIVTISNATDQIATLNVRYAGPGSGWGSTQFYVRETPVTFRCMGLIRGAYEMTSPYTGNVWIAQIDTVRCVLDQGVVLDDIVLTRR